MLKIYGFDLSPPANGARMCANALGLEYEYAPLDMFNGEHTTDWYRAVNPRGKVPAIDDDGFTLSESVAIMKYLSRKTDADLYPRDLERQAVVDQWCSYVSVHIYMAMNRVVFNKVAAPKLGMPVDESSLRTGQEFLARFLPVVEDQLAETRYLAGDHLTIADICLLSTLDPAEMIELDLSVHPNLSVWRDELREQDFYRKVHAFFGESMMAEA